MRPPAGVDRLKPVRASYARLASMPHRCGAAAWKWPNSRAGRRPVSGRLLSLAISRRLRRIGGACLPGERSSPGQASACQRPQAGAFFLTFSARGFSSAPDLAVMVLVGQQAREILAGGVAQQVAVHAHVVAKECLADAAVEQVGAEEIESLRFLPEGFGIHHAAALSWLV